ncbi:hypothetical protein MTR_1g033490 [Medicago truncatula]|uniref:Uncharacterized protein n=1 Tax=Medicago truncatula TaxID=3880 RepID=A0A072VFW3_MEDTR|nr:hypothetical protein MTR_1g033490 [Medicago truncatula]
MRSLLSSWRSMVTAIAKSKDLKTMEIDYMIRTLRAREDNQIKKCKMTVSKASEVHHEATDEYEIMENPKDQHFCEEEVEDELTLILKKIRRMLKMRDKLKKTFPFRKE